MTVSEDSKKAWNTYLLSLDESSRKNKELYDVFSIGDSAEGKNVGAGLVLARKKTSTSALLWDPYFKEIGIPFPGAISILEDGEGRPICLVETVSIEIKKFKDIGEQFAIDYAEWGNSLDAWKAESWPYYSEKCRELNIEPTEDVPLICEYFKVIYEFS